MEELEINLLTLAKELARRWMVFLLALVLGLGGGYVLTRLITKKYLARISFVPEKGASENQSLSGLSLLTGKLGLGGDGESPPYISHFEDFLKTRNFTASLQSRLSGDTLGPLLEKWYGEESLQSESGFNSWVSSSVKGKKKDGLFILEALTKDSQISFGLVQATFKTFEERLQRTRMESIEEDLEFVRNLVAKNQAEMRKKSDELRFFLERNRGASSPQLQQIQQGLMLDLKLAEEKYILSIKELEMLKIKKEKKEGRAILIETPYLNPFPVFPSKSKFALGGGFAGVFFCGIAMAALTRRKWIARKVSAS